MTIDDNRDIVSRAADDALYRGGIAWGTSQANIDEVKRRLQDNKKTKAALRELEAEGVNMGILFCLLADAAGLSDIKPDIGELRARKDDLQRAARLLQYAIKILEQLNRSGPPFEPCAGDIARAIKPHAEFLKGGVPTVDSIITARSAVQHRNHFVLEIMKHVKRGPRRCFYKEVRRLLYVASNGKKNISVKNLQRIRNYKPRPNAKTRAFRATNGWEYGPIPLDPTEPWTFREPD